MISLFEKFRFSVVVIFLFGTSCFLYSCKSLNKGCSDSRNGEGKQPITNSSKKEKNFSRTTASRTETRRPRVAPQRNEKAPVRSVPSMKPRDDGKLPELKKVTKPEPIRIDDEASLMKEIPRTSEPKSKEKATAKAVPGVEGLIPLNGPIKIREDSANRIIDAGGNDVILSGDDGVFVITGGCGRLTLNGKNNQIQCDSVSQIEISGSKNTLILGSLGGGTIRGNNNDLSWGSGIDGLSPIVESYGSDNSMKRLE